MKSNLLREKFLAFFKKNGHKIEPSSSVIPAQDPTILFANAGMNQFKDLFLGNEKRSYNCAATSQKCIRAGGKHNDLDQVGFTDRHLTFFEMLGNFSFGAYFKEEAIKFAWDFLTEDLGIDRDKLSVTVHHSDNESYDIWHNLINLPASKISKLGDEDNFWQMGDTGPCGPCTEIFFDRGEEWDRKVIYGAKATRYLEIWNLVFMQYNQRENGQRVPLVQKGVDTGMGLERLCLILNQGETVYDTDLFTPIFNVLEAKTGIIYKKADYQTQAAFNVVADHLRSSCMIIADGGKPANDGRGYVLRKIVRRALLFLKKLTPDANMFAEGSEVVAKFFAQTYPAILDNLGTIQQILGAETARFFDNLQKGQRYFELFLQEAKGRGATVLPGSHVFKLYDTYGFPVEVSHVLAKENGLSVDIAGFEKEMQKQRELSVGKHEKMDEFIIEGAVSSDFIGYQKISCTAQVIWCQNRQDNFWFATAQTPFFAACGGQVSDHGTVVVADAKTGAKQEFTVNSVITVATGENKKAILLGLSHAAADFIKLQSTVELLVNAEFRANVAKNHTATHLLQAALQQVCGKGVQQAASLVHPDYLRFGLTLDRSLTTEEIGLVEKKVNAWIRNNFAVNVTCTTLAKANEMGAMALFGEKYNPETVRVVSVENFSAELCGGTHVSQTGDIGCFKIISEESMGTGVRSIIAKTGPKAVELFIEQFNIIKTMLEKFACKQEQLLLYLDKNLAESKSLQKEVKRLKLAVLDNNIDQLDAQFKSGKNFSLLHYQADVLGQEEVLVLKQKLIFGKNRLLFISNPSKNTNSTVPFVILLGSIDLQVASVESILGLLRGLGVKAGGNKGVITGSYPQEQHKVILQKLMELSLI